MKKTIVTLIAASLMTTLAISTVQAEKKAGSDNKPAVAAKGENQGQHTGGVPFRGKLSAVDTTAKTITIEGKEKTRTFQVTSETKIVKAGKPATLADAKVGDEVGGLAIKNGEKLELKSLRIGPKPEGEEKPKEKKQ